MNVPVICVCCMSVLLNFGIRYVVCNILFDCVHKIIFRKCQKRMFVYIDIVSCLNQ